MKKIITLSLIGLFLFQASSFAQDGRRAMIKARYDSLSPEQKKQLQDKVKARRDSLSPEQRKEMRQKMKERYDNMTPEQKEKIKERVKERTDSLGKRQDAPGRFRKRRNF